MRPPPWSWPSPFPRTRRSRGLPWDALGEALAADEGIAEVTPPIAGTHDTVLVIVAPSTGPSDEATFDLVHRLRNDVVPAALTGTGADALVGGAGAAAVDFAAHNAATSPWFIAVVLGLTFILLLVLFRSVLVPLKAVVVNLLSVGAAYGVVVAVFQWGWLSGAGSAIYSDWANPGRLRRGCR